MYAGKYDKAEFLIDADIEFYKIKKLLEKNPRVLKDDPVLSIDYMKIIGLVKQKKLLEDTNDSFAPDASFKRDWYDLDIITRDQRISERAQFDRYNKDMVLE